MEITLSQIITWLILGALAGSLAGALLAWKKEGYGYWKNLALGLVGALVGGLVFRLFKIDLGLGNIQVTAEDLIASIAGSMLFVLILWFIRRAKAVDKTA